MRLRNLLPVLLVPWIPSLLLPVAGQQPAAAPKAQAPEIVLPVSVSNKRGEPVPGLNAAEFSLTDNSKQQTIVSLQPGSNVPLQVGLLIDTSRAMSRSLDAERKAAENFVNLILPADGSGAKNGNQVFLIHFDKEVELLEDLTNSRSTLQSDLQQMGPTPAGQKASGPEATDSGNGRKPRVRGEGADLYDAIYLASHEVMKSVHGRKVLVVFSQGTDLNSKERINDAIDAAERAHTVVYTIYFRGDEESLHMGRGGVGNSMPPMYPGNYPYPGGYPDDYPYPDTYPGGGGGPSGVPPINGKNNLEDIAKRTGGRDFQAKRTSDLDVVYNLIAGELNSQYLLTYKPNPFDADGTFHKTALTTSKSGLVVTIPEGYYAPGGD